MKLAVVLCGGKQYKVTEGDELLVEKLPGKPQDRLTLEEVLLVADDKTTSIGQPTLKDARIEAKIISQTKGEKIRMATYKAKSRYRRVRGHRQSLTRVRIEKILTSPEIKSETPKAKK